mmetsp:Transcript_21617/g.57082  ORF Transcript_21617/g.57082 Transcript_21617/m.57082 type:complete len:212 (+) Transcript_21617:641-1276(+)
MDEPRVDHPTDALIHEHRSKDRKRLANHLPRVPLDILVRVMHKVEERHVEDDAAKKHDRDREVHHLRGPLLSVPLMPLGPAMALVACALRLVAVRMTTTIILFLLLHVLLLLCLRLRLRAPRGRRRSILRRGSGSSIDSGVALLGTLAHTAAPLSALHQVALEAPLLRLPADLPPPRALPRGGAAGAAARPGRPIAPQAVPWQKWLDVEAS